MSKEFPYQQIRSLLLEYLAHHISGKYEVAVNGVIDLAKTKGLYSGPESRVDTLARVSDLYSKQPDKPFNLNGL